MLIASTAAVGGPAMVAAPAAFAEPSAPTVTSATTASSYIICVPLHRGPGWQWYDDGHGHHFWRRWEWDSRHHRWAWHNYYNDNQRCRCVRG